VSGEILQLEVGHASRPSVAKKAAKCVVRTRTPSQVAMRG
jgi:hypothetical protein